MPNGRFFHGAIVVEVSVNVLWDLQWCQLDKSLLSLLCRTVTSHFFCKMTVKALHNLLIRSTFCFIIVYFIVYHDIVTSLDWMTVFIDSLFYKLSSTESITMTRDK
jgi:hypothetical protein